MPWKCFSSPLNSTSTYAEIIALFRWLEYNGYTRSFATLFLVCTVIHLSHALSNIVYRAYSVPYTNVVRELLWVAE